MDRIVRSVLQIRLTFYKRLMKLVLLSISKVTVHCASAERKFVLLHCRNKKKTKFFELWPKRKSPLLFFCASQENNDQRLKYFLVSEHPCRSVTVLSSKMRPASEV